MPINQGIGQIKILTRWMKLKDHHIIAIHPEAGVNVCTKFIAIHPTVVDISLKTTNLNLSVALKEKTGDH